MPRGKIDLEKIRASLATACPHSGARIEPFGKIKTALPSAVTFGTDLENLPVGAVLLAI